MYPPVFAVCSASAAVKALIGTSPVRLYMFGMAPQNVAYPYAVWQQVGGAPENYLGQTPDIDTFTTQIDVYADTQAQARAVAQALSAAIEPAAHVTRWGADSQDPETKRYRSSFDVDWWTSR